MTEPTFKRRDDIGFARPNETHLVDGIIECIETGELFSMCHRETVEQMKERGAEIVNLDEFIAEHDKRLTTQPVPVSKSHWWYMLEVLPPCSWKGLRGESESFYMSEFYSGSVTTHMVRIGEQYFEFRAPVMSEHHDRVKYVREWLDGNPEVVATIREDENFVVMGTHPAGQWQVRCDSQEEAVEVVGYFQ